MLLVLSGLALVFIGYKVRDIYIKHHKHDIDYWFEETNEWVRNYTNDDVRYTKEMFDAINSTEEGDE